jgi:hypothetical protein
MELLEQKKDPKFYKGYVDLGWCKTNVAQVKSILEKLVPLGKKTKEKLEILKGPS